MKEIKIGKKKYKIQYGYKVVAKYDILKKVIRIESVLNGDSGEGDFMDQLSSVMDVMAELLLAGLQKNHSDDFGFDIIHGTGKDEAKDKVYDILDEYYSDCEDDNPLELFGELSEELQNSGFLALLLRQMEKLSDESEISDEKATTETTK